MPGCPNGAVPAPAFAGTSQLVSFTNLSATLQNILKVHSPTSAIALTGSIIAIDGLCHLNPEPPPELTMQDWADNLAYTVVGGGGLGPKITDWIYQYLRYQVFLQCCVCSPFTLDPTKNCLHATNVTLPSGQSTTATLGTVSIEDQVYNSWVPDSGGNLQFFFNLGKVSNQTQAQATNWFLQFLGSDGQWVDMIRGDAFPEGSHTDLNFTIQNGRVRLPQVCAMRIRTTFGGSGLLTSLDFCFKPAPAAPQPLPPDPNDTGVPVVPPPVCGDSDLCAIVLELARQVTRIGGQVSDLQAALTTTDQYSAIGSVPISGEGQVDVVLGTRAVSVELTTLGPTVFTSALGRPRGLMRAGSIRWGTGTGYTPRVFIDGETWTVPRPQGGLSVSWQLLTGTSGQLVFLQ